MLPQTHLYREIHQQPAVLETLLKNELPIIKEIAKAAQSKKVSYAMIAARGTSDNAARYAQYLFGAVNNLPAMLATPSLYSVYKNPPHFQNALVIGISQSGKSPDIVSVLAEGKRQGALTVAITNFSDSDLARTADFTVELHAAWNNR